MLTYSQGTGILKRDGLVTAQGYAGKGIGLFNPGLDNVQDVGPLPQGRYTLRKEPPSHLGPTVYALIPDSGNEMHGRSGFFIHWDNGEHKYSASHGCIVLHNGWMFDRLQEGDSLYVIP